MRISDWSSDVCSSDLNLVGYGCTTCIGNSGPLDEPIANSVDASDLTVGAVLSGNRNFEGRVHPQVKANYLASPPLVVAYALAGAHFSGRSEEHTSELQSLMRKSYALFRLKKKNRPTLPNRPQESQA